MINTLAIFIGNILAMVIVSILMLNLPYDFPNWNIQTRVFTHFSAPVIMGAVFGMGSAYFDGMPGNFGRIMVIICGSAGIIMPIVVGHLFWIYVELTAKGSFLAAAKRIVVSSLPMVFIFILVIVNIFNPILFTVTADNIYRRGPLGLIAFIVAPAYLVVALFRIAYIKSKKRGFLFVSLAGVIVPIAVLGVIQIRFYGVMQAWLGLAIAMVSLYIGFERDLLYTDSMTGAFNRVYLDYIINEANSKGQTLGGIMIDIDRFKSINDTLGHSMGDEVIKRTVSILKRSVDEDTNIIRVGGDEFLVVTHTDKERDLAAIIKKIRENCKAESAKRLLPLDIELSMGSAIYVPGEGMEAKWLSRMDKGMYLEKEEHHNKLGIDRRASDGSTL